MVRTVEDALALREAGIGQICMGEVRGRAPDGFDFGNSPFEISERRFPRQDDHSADQRRDAGHRRRKPVRAALRGLVGHSRGDRPSHPLGFDPITSPWSPWATMG